MCLHCGYTYYPGRSATGHKDTPHEVSLPPMKPLRRTQTRNYVAPTFDSSR